jgi:hypothetical protein
LLNCGGLEDREGLVSRSEDLDHPWPMVIRDAAPFFEMIDSEPDAAMRREELSIAGVDISRKAALNEVSGFQPRHFHGTG